LGLEKRKKTLDNLTHGEQSHLNAKGTFEENAPEVYPVAQEGRGGSSQRDELSLTDRSDQ